MGWFVVDVSGIDGAIEIASRLPGTLYCGSEIRPILDFPQPNS